MNNILQKFKIAVAVSLLVILAMAFSLLFVPNVAIANASTIDMEARLINITQLEDYFDAPNEIAIVKIDTYDQYASIMRNYVGSIDSASEYPYAIAFLPLPSGMTVIKLEAASDAQLVSAAKTKYLQDITLEWGAVQSATIANFTNSLHTSNLFGANDTVTLGYTFSGNYAKGTMWLNSYVIAQVNNQVGNVGMQRVLSVVVNSKNTLWNQNYSQTVLNQTNILFPVNI